MSDLPDILDDFDSIEKSGSVKYELLLSNVHAVKIGGFGDIDLVKTYLCSLRVEELEQDIQFYETLSNEKSWPVSQIVQREVDKIRVSGISKDYVLGKGRVVKYFPPIIVAILPRGPEGKIDLKLDYTVDDLVSSKEAIYDKSNYRNNPDLKKYFGKATNKSLINGLYLLEISKVFDFNILCWDKSKYYAIVIDGQHRLDALIKSRKENDAIKNYYQDVVFLDFSPLIKKLNTKDQFLTPVEVVRRIFIDINTNAKKVDIVRQILMDDKNLASLLVQSLVDSVNRDGSDKDPNKFLPSQLVDWYGDSLKHSLPHLTGVLSLYQILNDFLVGSNLSSIDDLRSPNKIKNFVKRLNDYFFVDRKIAAEGKYEGVTPLLFSLDEFDKNREIQEEYLQDIYNEFKETTLFTYDYRTIEIAQETFSQYYARGIIKFFNEFSPYTQAIETIRKEGGFDVDTTLYRALLSSKGKLFYSDSLKQSLASIKNMLEENLYPRFYILYTVLGQKAVFNLLFKRIFQVFNKDFNEGTCLRIVEGFLADINALLSNNSAGGPYLFGPKDSLILTNLIDEDEDLFNLGTIANSFWEGIIYEDNRIIYNSQGISSLSSFIEYLISIYNALENGKRDYPPFEITYLKVRTKRILKKRFDSLSDTDYEVYTNRILSKKEHFILRYLEDMHSVSSVGG